jgi:hypothetical protein
MEIETIEEKTRGILKDHKEVLFAYLYGSFAKGKAGKKSDIDIGLLLRDDYKADPLYESKISIRFDKKLGREVEVRILNNQPLTFLHQVLKYGKRLFSRNEKARIKFETDVYSRYLDIKPFYEEYNRLRRKKLLAK